MGRPVVLGSSATILLNGQDIAPSDETQIKNKDDVGLLVNAIRFTVSCDTVDIGGHGSAIRVQLGIGRTPLMQSPVPLWLLRTGVTDIERRTNAIRTYTWNFLKPMYLPPGQHLAPLFSYVKMLPTGVQTDPASVLARITLFGNLADRVPEIVSVPWACFFNGAVTTAGDAALLLAESRRTDLINPSPYALDVDRLTGRILINQSDADDEFNSASSTYASNDTTIRITSSDGEAIIKEPTAFAHAFSQPAKAWRMRDCKLPPFSYLLASLGVDYSDATAYGADSRLQPQIGLLGSRDMPLSMLGKG